MGAMPIITQECDARNSCAAIAAIGGHQGELEAVNAKNGRTFNPPSLSLTDDQYYGSREIGGKQNALFRDFASE